MTQIPQMSNKSGSYLRPLCNLRMIFFTLMAVRFTLKKHDQNDEFDFLFLIVLPRRESCVREYARTRHEVKINLSDR
jgi:hypothetical protein